ncbi:MAG: Trk system potassium transporter TrkA, partial [bacterium]
NIVICGMTKILTDAFSIARINQTNLVRSWRQGKRSLGVDSMIGSNFLTARAITQIIGLPSAMDVDTFVDGRVHMAEFLLPENSPLENQSIEEINAAGNFEELNVMAVFSETEEEMEFKFPRGGTIVSPSDRILVAGGMKAIHRFSQMITPDKQNGDSGEVVVLGGGEVGFQVSRILEDTNYTVRLIEHDEKRARTLAEELPSTLVLNHDAEDSEFLLEEHLDEANVVVAALGNDESNLLVSLLSKQLGANRAVSVVKNQKYIDLFEQVGLDAAINPRLLTAEEITRYTRADGTENVALLKSEHAEVLEFEIDRDSPIADREIQSITDDLPREVVFGAIIRDDDFILPWGKVVIKLGDHVLLLVAADKAAELQEQI